MIATIASRILEPESKLALSHGWENTANPTTLLPQVEQLQGAFNLKSVILVGDRGMISQKQVKALKGHSGVEWITALKTGAIRKFQSAITKRLCTRRGRVATGKLTRNHPVRERYVHLKQAPQGIVNSHSGSHSKSSESVLMQCH